MTTYRRCPAATWRRLPAGVVLALPGSRDALLLNAVGAVVWDLLQDPNEDSSLVSQVAAGFARPEAEVRAAVGALLSDLIALGAVVEQ